MTLKKIIYISIFCLLLFSCGKKNCHESITLTNKSPDTILYALEFNQNDSCGLAYRYKIAPMDSAHFFTRTCWEEEMKYRPVLDVYVLPKDEPNSTLTKYNCDSFLNKYNILRHYSLTIDSLVQNQFTLIYP